MNQDLPPDEMNEILELIFNNQKVMAIKRYRELRDTTLKEAKDFIDQLTDELRKDAPDKFKAPTGCVGVMAMFVTLLIVASFFLTLPVK